MPLCASNRTSRSRSRQQCATSWRSAANSARPSVVKVGNPLTSNRAVNHSKAKRHNRGKLLNQSAQVVKNRALNQGNRISSKARGKDDRGNNQDNQQQVQRKDKAERKIHRATLVMQVKEGKADRWS